MVTSPQEQGLIKAATGHGCRSRTGPGRGLGERRGGGATAGRRRPDWPGYRARRRRSRPGPWSACPGRTPRACGLALQLDDLLGQEAQGATPRRAGLAQGRPSRRAPVAEGLEPWKTWR
jgi:hypothetical protein